MKFEQYFERILKNESVNLFPELTGPIIPSFNKAVENCLQYYHTYPVSEHVLKSRMCTAKKIKEFQI